MRTKKKIAPIIIGIIFVLYFLGIAVFITIVPGDIRGKILPIIIIGAFMCLMIYVVIDRLKEIDKGEEDDLNNY